MRFLQPPPPPTLPLCLATGVQLLAKNTQIYTNLYSSRYLLILKIFRVASAVGVKETNLGFNNRLLHSF